MINTINIILDISFFVLIVICSITDIKKRIVPNSCIILLLVLGIIKTIINISIGYPWWFNLVGIVYVIPFFGAWLNDKMGAGDVKLILVSSLYLGVFNSLLVFIFMAISLLVFALISKMLRKDLAKSIPLVPFIMIGFIGCVVVRCFEIYVIQ